MEGRSSVLRSGSQSPRCMRTIQCTGEPFRYARLWRKGRGDSVVPPLNAVSIFGADYRPHSDDSDDTPSNSEGKDHDQYNTSSPGAISTTPDSTSGNGVGVLASVRALPVVLQILMILGLLAVLFLIKWLIVNIVRNLKRGRRRRRR